MLSKTPLDLILILSPSELHVPQALLCLKHGKHIFIEKPLANTLYEVDELEKARVESGMIVFVGYMRRYAGAVDLVKERLKGKVIKYVRVRELIGSVSPLSTSLLLSLLGNDHDGEEPSGLAFVAEQALSAQISITLVE
jgi:predicted dehydrogenase